MIFVTIGSMFPFDRLIRVMDEWTDQTHRSDVFAQIGDGTYEPRHMEFTRRLSQAEFVATVERAELTVAHAGMGTVITAGRMGRPLVLLPRIQDRGEHTTDHQIATANWLRGRPGIYIADSDADLPAVIAMALLGAVGNHVTPIPPVADPAFTDRIRATILGFTATPMKAEKT